MIASFLTDYKPLFSCFLYVAGLGLLYYNRRQLLYEKDKLSLGRVWSWVAFVLAIMYWAKFELGLIPPTTPFPPVLENFLYVCLLYEFGKKSTVMAGGITGMVLDKRKKTVDNQSKDTF
jgi:hypothetical protein